MTSIEALRADSSAGGGNGAPSVPFPSLRRLMRRQDEAEERCELCNAALAAHPRHEHLYEPEARQLLCACTPCAILFPNEAQKRYRRVGRRLWLLRDFTLTDAQWEALAIPVNMAFLHTTAPTGGVHAFYPSPAGPTESLLTLEGWGDIVAANPVLGRMEPDIEALLVHRVRGAHDFYLAPIDRCYELVGLIRLSWRGLSGGQELWERIGAWFESLRAQAQERDSGGA